MTVTVPDPAPLAVPVLRETLTLDGPAGAYTFAAALDRGGAPTGGRLTFHVSDPAALPRLQGDALLWGIDGQSRSLAHVTRPALPSAGPGRAGRSRAHRQTGRCRGDPAGWADLAQRLAQGATLLFLSAEPFRGSQAAMDWLPLQNQGRCYTFNDWLYHKECVAKRHPVFAGLQAPGIMDWDYYGPVIPHDIFEGQDTPAETIAAAFATGHHACPTGYACGL